MKAIDREQKDFTGNQEHLAVLLDSLDKETSRIWNDWRFENPNELPDLKGAYLPGADLSNFDFSGTSFDDSNLVEAEMVSCDLSGANFYRANMTRVRMMHASAYGAHFRKVNMKDAVLSGTVFNSADLKETILTGCKIHGIGRTGWEIKGVECDYIYPDAYDSKRFPLERDFEVGEFERLYKAYPLIDLEFTEHFDALTILLVNYAAIQLNSEDGEYDFQVKEISTYGFVPTIKVSVREKVQIKAGTAILKQRIAELEKQLAERQLDVNRLYGLLEETLRRPAVKNFFNEQTTIGQLVDGNIYGQQPTITIQQYSSLLKELESADLPAEKKSIGKELLNQLKDAATDEAKLQIREWAKTLTKKGLEQLPQFLNLLG